MSGRSVGWSVPKGWRKTQHPCRMWAHIMLWWHKRQVQERCFDGLTLRQDRIPPPGAKLLHFPCGCQAKACSSLWFLRANPFSEISSLQVHHGLVVCGPASPFPWQRQTSRNTGRSSLTHTFINWLPHIVLSWEGKRKRYCLFIQRQLKGLVLERRNKNLFNK